MRDAFSFKVVLATIFTTLLLAACAQNPVTGKKELILVGEDWELNTGKQYYAPMRQAQGGDYTADPGVEAYVQRVGKKLAAVSDRKLPYEFHVLNDSTPNAWALPGGKIVINRGLLVELDSEAELAAVLGHEIVHAAAKHGARAQTRGLGLQLASVGATIGLGGRIGAQNAQMISGLGATLVNQSYGRKAERESDHYGMIYMRKAGYDPQGAVDLQKTFVKLSQQRGGKAGKFQRLLQSHPPSQSRVSDNIKTMKKLPEGGVSNEKQYRKAIARLLKTKPAYDSLDSAAKAFKEGELKKARSLVNKAIKIEPREPLFYSALGDLEREQKKYKNAKKWYDKAISLNDQFYYYYLRRGETNKITKNFAAAKRDLQRSYKLLPTSDAKALLGDVANLTNDRAGAIEAWSIAAKSNDAAGKYALGRLAEVDAGKNPSKYISAKPGLSSKGTLAVRLTNRTPVAMKNVAFAVHQSNTGSRIQRKVPGVIDPGKAVVIDTGIKIKQETLKYLSASVTRAAVVR